MKNGERDARRRKAAARVEEYAQLDAPKPKFIKWLRGKFGMTTAERFGAKPREVKVGVPYTRVQRRAH